MPFRGTWELRGNHSSIIWPFCRRFNWQRMNTDRERSSRKVDRQQRHEVNAKTSSDYTGIKNLQLLTDVTFFALFCFVA